MPCGELALIYSGRADSRHRSGSEGQLFDLCIAWYQSLETCISNNMLYISGDICVDRHHMVYHIPYTSIASFRAALPVPDFCFGGLVLIIISHTTAYKPESSKPDELRNDCVCACVSSVHSPVVQTRLRACSETNHCWLPVDIQSLPSSSKRWINSLSTTSHAGILKPVEIQPRSWDAWSQFAE